MTHGRRHVAHAKAHLEELVARAARGEDVSIVDPKVGKVKLSPAGIGAARRASLVGWGCSKGRLTVPARLLEPMTEEEMADWYGDKP